MPKRKIAEAFSIIFLFTSETHVHWRGSDKYGTNAIKIHFIHLINIACKKRVNKLDW